jgi:exopolyphosphatase/guanosine-5'-triphosphate,3'-diphosphate pyrophosphatase
LGKFRGLFTLRSESGRNSFILPRYLFGVRVAVLDLGSTSFRLVVADWGPNRGLVRKVQRRERLNLGLVVGREGHIPEPHASAAVKAVRKLRRRAELSGSDRIVAVATSALRDARNREKVVRRLAAAAGVPVRILSGDEEAALTFAAMRAGLPLGDGRQLGVDLGGGSLELAIGAGPRLEWTASLPLGASRLAGSFIRHDPVTASERARLEAHIDTTLEALPALTRRLEGRLGPLTRRLEGRLGTDFWPAGCVAAGGTVKALARLMIASGTAAGPLNGLYLPTGDIEAIGERLIAKGHRHRARLPGMDRQRADVLGAGTLVVAHLLRRLDLGGVTVSEWGLREGVILEAVGRAQGTRAALGAKLARQEPVPAL